MGLFAGPSVEHSTTVMTKKDPEAKKIPDVILE